MRGDGANAVQILLLIGGLTLIPALLFCVTGFTRILIVLGFIRTAIGTPTAPPNQVLVGIALFLTLFVMAPTFNTIKDTAWDPLQAHRDRHAAGDQTRRGAAARLHVQADARRRPRALRAALEERESSRERAGTSRRTS